jgi:hypothetical protein
VRRDTSVQNLIIRTTSSSRRASSSGFPLTASRPAGQTHMTQSAPCRNWMIPPTFDYLAKDASVSQSPEEKKVPSDVGFWLLE